MVFLIWIAFKLFAGSSMRGNSIPRIMMGGAAAAAPVAPVVVSLDYDDFSEL